MATQDTVGTGTYNVIGNNGSTAFTDDGILVVSDTSRVKIGKNSKQIIFKSGNSEWQTISNFGCSTAADLASLLGAATALTVPANSYIDLIPCKECLVYISFGTNSGNEKLVLVKSNGAKDITDGSTVSYLSITDNKLRVTSSYSSVVFGCYRIIAYTPEGV